MIITSKLPGIRLKFEFTPKILGTQRREKLTKWEERPYMLRFSITCPEVIPVICQLSRIQTFRSPEIWKSLFPWLVLRNHCHIRFHDSPNNKPHTHEMEQFASKKVPESKGDFRERSLHYTNRFFSPFLRMYRVPTVSFVLLPRHIHAHDNFFFFALSIPVPRFAGSQDDVFGPLETLWGPRN